ncbi:hypothetical protein [Kiloniella sp.]|uniref:hypothetical protein n=1 Tax=Kiloniella sp. TaxID=1938587 RepID=UPI003B01BEA4
MTEEELADLYKAGVEEDLVVLESLLDDIKASPSSALEMFEKARGIVHNVKGQGASFGYPLMTEIGNSYYSILKYQTAQEEINPVVIKLYEAHLTAMKSIIGNKIRGEGPELLQKVAMTLKEKVELIISQ